MSKRKASSVKTVIPKKRRSRKDPDGNEYVYMIREREFVRLGEMTYKIGKTTQKPNSRLAGYPNNSEVVLYIKTPDCDKTEKTLIAEFDKRYTHRKEYGREYYEGNESQMKSTFFRVVCTEDEAAERVRNSWVWWAVSKINPF
jgi:hypothetical protein